ncbi:MAG: hypothetical protein ACRES8_09255, partial [Nevskiaceae bacterium]
RGVARAAGRLSMHRAAAVLAMLACALGAAEPGPVIEVENEAAVPAAELESILKDFRAWAARVYRYHHVTSPPPVTLRLTRKVPFGFYQGSTVILPPSADRWEMLDNWVHELTHHATGHESSFFFKEGIAVHTLEALFAQDRRVPAGWPQFGQGTDAWVATYAARGRLPALSDVLTWPRYQGDTPEHDFRSWQIYNIAGSFCGWYVRRFGYPAFREAFAREWPAQDSARLQREWLADIAGREVQPFDPAAVLPLKRPRYRAYAERLR